MRGIIDLFVPREKKFFELLSQQNQLFKESMALLYKNRKKLFSSSSLKEIENSFHTKRQKEEEITRTIIHSLHQTFITPIDSAEILGLTSGFHRLFVSLEKIIFGFKYLKLPENDLVFEKQISLLYEITESLNHFFPSLLHKKNREIIKKIVSLEEEADKIYQKAMVEIFSNNLSPIDLIKKRELYELCENAIDDTKAIADLMESILINHS